MVAEREECSGSETETKFQRIEDCASNCKGRSSMFAFGTNDFGKNRCYEDGCWCLCETGAMEDGTCNRIEHDGFRLYRYDSNGMVIKIISVNLI